MISKAQFEEKIAPFTLQYEAGWVNNPKDKGGETYRGISRKFNPNWNGWALIDKSKPLKYNQILPQLEPGVNEFYWNRFRNEGYDKADSTKVALAMFDYNVHGGFNLSVMKNIIKDKFNKIIMPESVMNWVNGQNEDNISKIIIEHRDAYLKKIIQNDPTQKEFESGWNNRIKAIKKYINLKTVGISAGVILLLLAIIIIIFIRREQNV